MKNWMENVVLFVFALLGVTLMYFDSLLPLSLGWKIGLALTVFGVALWLYLRTKNKGQ